MRARLPLLALPPLLVIAAGCQLCGLEPARCRPPEDEFHACGPDDYCSDEGYCRPVPRAPLRGECAEGAADTEVRDLHLAVGTGGAAAMGDKLGAQTAVLSCGSDATACGLVAIGPPNDDVAVPVSLRAADDAGTTSSLDTVTFTSAGAPLDLAGGFALEAVFRTPSQPGAAPIVTISDGIDGVELGTDPQGYLGFAVGGEVLGLSYPTLRTWHYALCVVDMPSLLAGGDDDDLLCVLDGVLLQTRVPSSGSSPLFDGPVTLGAYADGAPVSDPAVAVLRLWQGDPFADASSAGARQDALVDAASARLARFSGLAIDAPSDTLRVARLGFDFAGLNVKTQPLTVAGITRFELVPARWPRTAVAGGQAGLLIERFTEQLATGAILPCVGGAPSGATPAPGPGGAPGACDFGDTPRLFSGAVPGDAAFVPDRDDLSFSAFVDRAATVTLSVDDTTCAYADGVLDDSGRGSGECTLLTDFADGFLRLVARAERPPAGATWDASFAGVVWSPQLEVGSDATTPFVVPVASSAGFEPSAYRILDMLSLERIGLTRGESTSTVVSLVPLGDLDVGEITLSESNDFVRNLVLDVEESDPGVAHAGGLLQDDLATIEMRGTPVAAASGQLLTFGVDLGTPVVRCGERCNGGVGAGNLESPGQWEVLKVAGGGAPFVLSGVDVATRGTPPLEVAFELRPEVAPTGCFAGRYPDVSLVGCAQGACTEGTSSRVVWTGALGGTPPGPGLEERAVSGALVAERLAVDADALFFEVRFEPAGEGTVLALEDSEGPVLSVVVEGGHLALERRGESPVPFQVVNPAPLGRDDVFIPYDVVDGTWVQASCWIGAESACATNLDYLQLFTAAPLEASFTRARVGEAAAAVAFARVWSQPGNAAAVDVIRLSSERIATSFGLGMVARRSPTLVIERRLADAVIEREGASLTVGPAWPRVDLVDGAPAYLSDVDAREQLSLAFAFDLVGDNRGILDVALAELPAPDSYFYVLLDASDPSQDTEDYLAFALTSEDARLGRRADDDTTDAEAGTAQDVVFDGVRSATVNLSWRGGVMTAAAEDGAVAVREVLQFPVLGFVNAASIGSGRAEGVVVPSTTALRRIRISSR